MHKTRSILRLSMEIQTSIGHNVTFSWDKAHNDAQISNIEDELSCAFRGIPLITNLVFRRNSKTRIDEIILIVSKMEAQKAVRICEISCNPGQLRTVEYIIEEVRRALK